MTLKHISFSDSPTMRALEKIAVKKGLVKAKPVEAEIVKEASVKYASTNDVQQDLITLISGLRDKGFVKESQDLEDKLYQFKTAGTHLYRAIDEDGQDLLDFAHPDGDVKVGDSPYGVVETLDSTQKKIIDIINKKPTGKFANEIKSLVLATAQALGVDLVKTAQLSEEQAGELSLDSEKKDKAKAITGRVAKDWSAAKTQITTALETSGVFSKEPATWLKFDPWKVLQGQGVFYYLEKLGDKQLKPSAFGNFYKTWTKIFGEEQASEEVITQKIMAYGNAGNGNALYSLFVDVDKSLANKYFLGARFNDYESSADEEERVAAAAKDVRYRHNNPNSVWTVDFDAVGAADIDFDSKVAVIAGGELYKKLTETFNGYVGSDKIEQASTVAAQEIKENLKMLYDLLRMQISPIRKTTSLAINDLQNIGETLDSVIEYNLKNVNSAYQAMGFSGVGASLVSSVVSAKKTVDGTLQFLNETYLDPVLDVPVEAATLQSLAGGFKQIAVYWDTYIKKKNPNDQAKQVANNNISMAVAAYKALTGEEIVSKPFGYIRMSLPEGLANLATSPEALQDIVAKGLTMAREAAGITLEEGQITLKKSEELDSSLVKEGQWQSPTAPAGGKAVAPGSGSKAQPSSGTAGAGLQRFNPNAPDQVAVAKMQLALNNLGRLVSSEENRAKFSKVENYDPSDGLKIIGTGPKSNPHLNMFDGKWGSNTASSLAVAQKYLSALGLKLSTEARWDPKTKAHTDGAINAATQNTNALNQMANYITGKTVGLKVQDSVLDALPRQIHWDSEGSWTASLIDHDRVQLMKTDLASFASLYSFLTKNGLREAETVGVSIESAGTEGFSYRTWSEVLPWFMHRAEFLYNAAKEAKNSDGMNRAREYYLTAKNLLIQYRRFITFYTKNFGQFDAENVPDWNLLNRFSKPTSAVPGLPAGSVSEDGRGSTYSNKTRKDLEGTKHQMSSTDEDDSEMPFSNYIDFRKSRWADFDVSELNAPYLRLKDLLRIPGKRMAQTMFAGEAESLEEVEMTAAKKRLGKKPVAGYDPTLGPLVDRGENLAPVFTQMERNQLNLSRSPLYRYQKFLNNLGGKLHQVMQEWSQDTEAPPALLDNLQDYYKEWQRAIEKQFRDLKR